MSMSPSSPHRPHAPAHPRDAADRAATSDMAARSPSRRDLLGALLGAAAWLTHARPALAAREAPERAPAEMNGRLVVVFLRGAYDGLSALVPWADTHYAAARPSIAIPAPGRGDGDDAAIALDDTFALHPALAPLRPLWRAGVLGVIPCAGSPDPTRSHFDAQHHWEVGIPGRSAAADGWLNTLTSLRPGSRALGIGEANPLILAGAAPVQLLPHGQAALRPGVLGRSAARDAVLRLYADDDPLARAFRRGAQSRRATADILSDAAAADPTATAMMPLPAGSASPDVAQAAREMRAANNGAGAARGLRLDAQHLGTLMRRDPALRVGFLSAGGWDTHVNQGASRGALANNLAALAEALVQLRQDFNRPNDVVAVVSEFGRTAAENGSRGTDHGHGNALWLMGDAVAGGRWHGRWDGLAPNVLHEGRDLPVHHDFRAVFARVLGRTAGLSDAEAQRLFPGYRADPALAGLMRS